MAAVQAGSTPSAVTCGQATVQYPAWYTVPVQLRPRMDTYGGACDPAGNRRRTPRMSRTACTPRRVVACCVSVPAHSSATDTGMMSHHPQLHQVQKLQPYFVATLTRWPQLSLPVARPESSHAFDGALFTMPSCTRLKRRLDCRHLSPAAGGCAFGATCLLHQNTLLAWTLAWRGLCR